MTPVRELAPVVANEPLAAGQVVTARAPLVAAAARPFQFVLAAVPDGRFPLRRPFSVFDVKGEDVSVLIRQVGSGTARLAALEPGAALDIIGPLGKEFLPEEGAVFVAGGIGIAGIYFALAERARRGEQTEVYFGARNADELYAADLLAALPLKLTFVTEDGSRGIRGKVVEFVPRDAKVVVACGPRAMYRSLLATVSPATRVYVLMEERMACGVGACRGCVVPVTGEVWPFVTVCREGPVFDGRTIAWEKVEDRI